MPFIPFVKALFKTIGKKKRPSAVPKPSFRPLLELLENRILPTTFFVTSNGDNANNLPPIPGSLRDVIMRSNLDQRDPSNQIIFNLQNPIITPLAELPAITWPVILMGAPSISGGRPAFQTAVLNGQNLDGRNGRPYANGLTITKAGGGSLITGLTVINFGGYGIVIEDTITKRGVSVLNCYIGTDSNGNNGGNGRGGILIDNSSDNVIGTETGTSNLPIQSAGSPSFFSNVISGNGWNGTRNPWTNRYLAGITIANNSNNNQINDNIIGLTPPNSPNGVRLPNYNGISIAAYSNAPPLRGADVIGPTGTRGILESCVLAEGEKAAYPAGD